MSAFPTARTLRFGTLADRSFSLFVLRLPEIVGNCRLYFLTFFACLALFLWILPQLPVKVPQGLALWIWVCLCLPLWQWTLRRLHGTGRINPLGLLLMMPLNVLGAPFFLSLVFAIQAGEGLGWKAAARRSSRMLRDHGSLVVGLLAAWLTLPYLLANLFEFFVQGCLPYVWGVFDVSLDIKGWVKPCVWAVQCLLAALVMPGFELSLALLRQEYAACREGGELLAALEQEYGS